jgi:outer membrane biosynthesis protein TonB
MAGMDDFRRLEAKGLARAKIRARRKRVSSIRTRTIRCSLALFAVAWAIVFAQLVTGNDPALSRSYATTGKLADSSRHRRPAPVSSPPAEVAVAPEAEAEPEGEAEPEAAPEVEPEPEIEVAPEPEPEVAPEPEIEVAPEPEPVITSAS